MIIHGYTAPERSHEARSQLEMRRLVGALLAHLEQDDTFVLQALGDPHQRGLHQLRLICESNFTHDVSLKKESLGSVCQHLHRILLVEDCM